MHHLETLFSIKLDAGPPMYALLSMPPRNTAAYLPAPA